MNDFLEIKIGLGLSKLAFGASMSDVEQLLGKANKEELLNELEEYPTIVWYYDDFRISLFFDAKVTELFVCADIENPEATLWDEKIFSLGEAQIIALFKSNGIYLFETELQEWGEKRLSFDEANVDFYFANNKLISINYGIITEGSQTLILPN
jgi:hypothetical protein